VAMARAADPRRERRREGVSLRRQLWSAAAAVVTLAALTIALRAVRDDVSLTMVFLVYFAAVVALSAAGGPIVGLAVALAAFGVVNFFFTEPLHTFNVAEAEQLIELLIFLAVSGTVATLVDTASRRLGEIEAQSEQAAQLEATNDLRTALLRAVSHDLRTPLATAKMATSSLLATDVELPPESRIELLELADAELDRLVRLVENLLDAGRLQAGVLDVAMRPVSVDDLFARTLAALPDGDRPRVMAWLAEGATTIVTDPALLERVLANLITNALAADPTGHIAVNAEPGDTPGTAVLDVVDHGPGMTDEQRANAFAPFQRYDDRAWSSGIGLGLPICKGFCEAIGATLELIGSEGGGLTARISVPVAAPRSSA
jgi:two-component system sensor histidine kinase KdpD